ncbi:hypothetical protein ES703_21658 [subsurface metagenome]|nr:hypothetical protein [bacterium]
MSEGFIPLLRSIRDRPSFLKEKPFNEDKALFDLLCEATFQGRRVEGVLLTKGQALVKKKQLTKRWGWSREKVSRFFKRLAQERGEAWAIEEEVVSVSSSNPHERPRTIGTRITFIYWSRFGK